mmetsp:Transcript_3854/g.6356  ORF Transcript_3854/g.6356 Transcript_3854/m.6356 type:complete len:88 (-) Transcript_3854:59-322(-)
MIACDAQMRVVLAKKLCHSDDVQTATYDGACNEKGQCPKMKSTNRKNCSFKRNKCDDSSSSSFSSAAQMEETEKSQDEMEIYRGFYA